MFLNILIKFISLPIEKSTTNNYMHYILDNYTIDNDESYYFYKKIIF
jgi:hypothetical protein